jgi:nucleotide-binding universal stress UspA family protein
MMFRRVLVPLDGSRIAERALPIAARIARASGGTIILVRVVTTPLEQQSTLTPSLPSGSIQAILELGRAEANTYLRRIAASNDLQDIATEIEVCIGQAVPLILSVAHSRNIDLIVLSRHGHRGVTRWGIGSVAEKVVYDTWVPVLVIHGESSTSSGAQHLPGHFFHGLVPLDGSPQAEEAIIPAAHLITALSEPGKGILSLTQIVGFPFAPGAQESQQDEGAPSLREHILHETQNYLGAVVDHLDKEIAAALRLSTTWAFLSGEDVAETLLKVTELNRASEHEGVSGDYNLLAMTTYGRVGMRHRIIGSITGRILRTTKLPMLIVQPQELSSSLRNAFAGLGAKKDIERT